jgi:putative membrane protein
VTTKPDASGKLVGALADGEWHRLHPATPLLRGGIALIAIIGILLANLRDRVIEFVLHFEERDPIDELIDRGWLLPGLLIVVAVLVIGVGGFWLSWRLHEFRVTDEVVEVRSGILFRTQRKARLDRIQGVNIVRPLIPRLFGAARLQISVAGSDGGVKLDYLPSSAADTLRRDVLTLASGSRRSEAAPGAPGTSSAPPATGGLIERRVGEFLAPELDPDEAEPNSVVHLSLGRLIGSTFLRDSTIILLLVIAIGLPWVIIADAWYTLVGIVPGMLGLVSYTVNRFTRSLRYSIAGTSNGIRIGFGLLSTSNETLPPGRIHAVEVSQPLLWRITGWWQIKITRASASRSDRSGSTANMTVLPVGDRRDVERVLALLLPLATADEIAAIVGSGLHGRGADDDGFTNSPSRARVLRPLAWRRTGFRLGERLLEFRKGRIWRSIIVLPLARLQSVSVSQGPVYRVMSLAEVHAHVVSGPIYSRLGAIDVDQARQLFERTVAGAEEAGRSDASHRWNAGADAAAEQPVEPPVAAQTVAVDPTASPSIEPTR